MARPDLSINWSSERGLTIAPGGAARLRPALPSRALPALTTSLTSYRQASNVPAEDPKKKAQSILDSLPGNSLISKTAILSSTAGVAIYALSNEYYVVNEETIVALCLLSIWTAVFKYGGPMYKEWADGQVNKIKGILNAARADHTEAVKSRIESVQQLGSVVDVTKTLFEVSKVRVGAFGGMDAVAHSR
jgi:F-type H+-transporting ATPase subunit b